MKQSQGSWKVLSRRRCNLEKTNAGKQVRVLAHKSQFMAIKGKDPFFLFPMAWLAIMGRDALAILNTGRRCISSVLPTSLCATCVQQPWVTVDFLCWNGQWCSCLFLTRFLVLCSRPFTNSNEYICLILFTLESIFIVIKSYSITSLIKVYSQPHILLKNLLSLRCKTNRSSFNES